MASRINQMTPAVADQQIRVAITDIEAQLLAPTSDEQKDLVVGAARAGAGIGSAVGSPHPSRDIAGILEALPYAPHGDASVKELVGWMVDNDESAYLEPVIDQLSTYPELQQELRNIARSHLPLPASLAAAAPPPPPVPPRADLTLLARPGTRRLTAAAASQQLAAAAGRIEDELSAPYGDDQHQVVLHKDLPLIEAALPYASSGTVQLGDLVKSAAAAGASAKILDEIIGTFSVSPGLTDYLKQVAAANAVAPSVDTTDPDSAIRALQPGDSWTLGWGLQGGLLVMGGFDHAISVTRGQTSALAPPAGSGLAAVQTRAVAPAGVARIVLDRDRYIVTINRKLSGGLLYGFGPLLGLNLAVIATVNAGTGASLELSFSKADDAIRAVRILQTLNPLQDPLDAVNPSLNDGAPGGTYRGTARFDLSRLVLPGQPALDPIRTGQELRIALTGLAGDLATPSSPEQHAQAIKAALPGIRRALPHAPDGIQTLRGFFRELGTLGVPAADVSLLADGFAKVPELTAALEDDATAPVFASGAPLLDAVDEGFLAPHVSAIELSPLSENGSGLAIAGVGPFILAGLSASRSADTTYRFELPGMENPRAPARLVTRATYGLNVDASQFSGASGGGVSAFGGGIGEASLQVDAVDSRSVDLPGSWTTHRGLAQALGGDTSPISEQAGTLHPGPGSQSTLEATLSLDRATDVAGGTTGKQVSIQLTGDPADTQKALWDLAHFIVPQDLRGKVRVTVAETPVSTSGLNQPSLGVVAGGAMLMGHVEAAITRTDPSTFSFSGDVVDAIPRVWDFMRGEYTAARARQEILDGSLSVDGLAGLVAAGLLSVPDLETLASAHLVDPMAFARAFHRRLVTEHVSNEIARNLANAGLIDGHDGWLSRQDIAPGTPPDQIPPQAQPPPLASQARLLDQPLVNISKVAAALASKRLLLVPGYGNAASLETLDMIPLDVSALEQAADGRQLRMADRILDPAAHTLYAPILDSRTGDVLFFLVRSDLSKLASRSGESTLWNRQGDRELWSADPAEQQRVQALWRKLYLGTSGIGLGTLEQGVAYGRNEVDVPMDGSGNLVKAAGAALSSDGTPPAMRAATAAQLDQYRGDDLRYLPGVTPDGKPAGDGTLVDLTHGTVVGKLRVLKP